MIQSIGYWPSKWAHLSPDKTAIVEGERRLNFEDFNTRVNCLVNALKNDLKVKKGDRVSILTTNRTEFIESWFAASKLGAILTPLNFRLAEEELAYMFDDTRPRVLIYDNIFREKVEKTNPSSLGVNYIIELNDEEHNEYEKLIKENPDEEPRTEVKITDPCVIPYTGGTTGLPKGAVLTHSNVTFHTLSMIKNTDMTAKDTTLTVLPLFHTGGLNLFTTPTIYQGGTLVLQRKFDPEETLEIIERENISIVFAVPAIFRELAYSSKFDEADLSSIRIFMNGGDYCPPELMEKYHEKNLNFIHSYGLTESSPGVLANRYTDDKAQEKSKEGSVGKPLFYSAVKIVDDKGEEVETGESGELLTKGPHVIEKYWNKPEETQEAFSNGWLHTGDIARRDEEDYYYIEGRKKDMIVSGGENIYLSEVERVLSSHPQVKEAAVIGVPSEKWGEVGMAIIVLEGKEKTTKEEILSYCQGKLAKYKIPKSVKFAESLPVGPAGSVDKKKLREKYA
ncbi:hypothetical protein AKJ37_05620 [candidate division MSBL1 archaeon SCGC-AAA259I09]|uniref:Long-chain fatty acid--CoA ligase n=1 Tax=candidate division MSBL1 archaeon SCGC-AAA259I09 TaxID=1698267 RepID=A0A133UQ47_9EURY|nr:hypothetical protein AKJ37_05620 [candidate division MSBL1 archaeon SCGC-AAA259I09]